MESRMGDRENWTDGNLENGINFKIMSPIFWAQEDHHA